MKIAIVKLSALGDIVHAMVVLQYIKATIPNIEIDWIVEEAFAPVLEHNPHIDNILTVNLKSIKKNKLNFFKEFKKVWYYRKNDYDMVIDAQGLMKSAITARILGKVAGFSKVSIREKMASWFYASHVDIAYHENAIKRNIKVITTPLQCVITQEQILHKKPFLYFNPKETLPMAIEEYIVLIVGASVKNKIYPKEKFAEIAQGLKKKTVVIWANEYEREVAAYLGERLDNIVVLPKLTLNQVKKLLADAKLVIGGDTGPTHMAWGLNTPSITLFGNTPAMRNAYMTPTNKVIQSASNVDAYKLDKDDFSIQTIPSEDIISLSKELLRA